MKDDIGSIAIALLVCFVVVLARPRDASCPHGHWLDTGVRGDGSFECAPLAPEEWQRGPRGGWVDTSPALAGRLFGRVFCDPGERAVTTDGVDVFCAIGGLL
jgi:hypothetical protein